MCTIYRERECYKPKLFKWKAIIVTEKRKDYSFISYIVGERFKEEAYVGGTKENPK